MRKKIIIIIFLFMLIIAVIGATYAIDMNRMNNNRPVLFSTWGYDYAPPEENPEDFRYPLGTNEFKNSFVGKVIEETTTYMIVEPVKDKADGDMGDKVKVEYGTDHYDYLYGQGRKVVI